MEVAEKHNRNPHGGGISAARTLRPMVSKAKRVKKPLTPAQKADAVRLNALWKSVRPMSQEKFAELYDMGTQGNVSQYLIGLIPLNFEAAVKFAHVLKVPVAVISKDFEKMAGYVLDLRELDPAREAALEMYARYLGASEPDRQIIDILLRTSDEKEVIRRTKFLAKLSDNGVGLMQASNKKLP